MTQQNPDAPEPSQSPDDTPSKADTSPGARTTSLVILACIATIAALYVGRDFFVPIVFGFVLSALFSPIVRAMVRLKIPTPVASAIVVLSILAILATSAYLLSGPVHAWIQSAPHRFQQAEQKFNRLKRPFQQAANVATKLKEATESPSTLPSDEDGSTTPPPTPHPAPAPATPAPAPAPVSYLSTTSKVVGGVTEALVLMFLVLASGDLFIQKLVKVMPLWHNKIAALNIVHETGGVVMRYLYVTLLINICQAVTVAIVMWWLGMPSPILWGAMTLVVEFVPYLGAALMIVLLSISAFTTFDSIPHILAIPFSYFLITTLQNNIVSPYAYGQHLKLNPVAVLIGVIFWWFVWGIPGTFLAVPLIATIKLLSDRADSWKVVGEFLGE